MGEGGDSDIIALFQQDLVNYLTQLRINLIAEKLNKRNVVLLTMTNRINIQL